MSIIVLRNNVTLKVGFTCDMRWKYHINWYVAYLTNSKYNCILYRKYLDHYIHHIFPPLCRNIVGSVHHMDAASCTAHLFLQGCVITWNISRLLRYYFCIIDTLISVTYLVNKSIRFKPESTFYSFVPGVKISKDIFNHDVVLVHNYLNSTK